MVDNVCHRHHIEPEFSLWKRTIHASGVVAGQDVASSASHLPHQARDFEPSTCSSVPSAVPQTDTVVGDDQLLTRNAESLAEITASDEVGASELSLATNNDPSAGGLSCQTVELSSVSETQQPESSPSASVAALPVADRRPQNGGNSLAETSDVKFRDNQNPEHMDSAPSDGDVVLSQSLTTVSDQLIVSSSSSSDSEAVNVVSVGAPIACTNSDAHLPVANNNQSLLPRPVSESLSAENMQLSPSEPMTVCMVFVCL